MYWLAQQRPNRCKTVRAKLLEQAEANAARLMGSKRQKEMVESVFSNVHEIYALNEKILRGSIFGLAL